MKRNENCLIHYSPLVQSSIQEEEERNLSDFSCKKSNMSYQDIPIQDVIEKMKERISSNQMSLLVGSGAPCLCILT